MKSGLLASMQISFQHLILFWHGGQTKPSTTQPRLNVSPQILCHLGHSHNYLSCHSFFTLPRSNPLIIFSSRTLSIYTLHPLFSLQLVPLPLSPAFSNFLHLFLALFPFPSLGPSMSLTPFAPPRFYFHTSRPCLLAPYPEHFQLTT